VISPARGPGGVQPGGVQPGGVQPGGPEPGGLQPGGRPAARPRDWAASAAWASAALVAAANVLAVTGYPVPFLGPALGFWFLVVHPVYLLCTTSVWGGSGWAERLGYSLGAVLLVLLLGGLGLNTVLPALGAGRPLDPFPVAALADAITVALYLLRRRYPARPSWRRCLAGAGPAGGRLAAGAGACVALAVLGANRLNNGAGGQLSLIALGGILVLAVLLLCGRHRLQDEMICVTVYLLSLALLLMTSLRGWYVTGHDVQTEYLAFQLTYSHAHWDIGSFSNPYNACLSITILPTELAQVTHVFDPYVFKVFFQLIFAVCPVLGYTIARRYYPKWVSIMAVVYFIGFPTFFTDMPFLNRQEMAFMFACPAILAMTQRQWGLRRRRLMLIAACLGMELSHYSTMYLFLGTLTVAWLAERGRWIPRRSRGTAGARPAVAGGAAGDSWTLSVGVILTAAVIAAGWGGAATGTMGGAVTDAGAVASSLIGKTAGVRSGDVAYGLLPGSGPSAQSLLDGYRRQTMGERDGSASAAYLPAALVGRYRTPAVAGPQAMPLTAAGRLLAAAGIPVDGLNTAIRQAAARGEQLFTIIGLTAILSARRGRRRPGREYPGREYLGLCLGSIVMVALITVLPDLSADYDVLRAFQASLLVLAPVLVAGSCLAFLPLGESRAARAGAAIGLALFASTIGFVPQVLGGYPAQLSLNNSGADYSTYYTHPQEVAAVNWLSGQPGVLPAGVQAENVTDRFAFTSPGRVSGRQVIGDIYPTLIRRSSWVILGYSTMHTGQASVFYEGNLISYAYPVGILQAGKNLVYNNGGTEIYR
jgi:uncharacterized membrane protein